MCTVRVWLSLCSAVNYLPRNIIVWKQDFFPSTEKSSRRLRPGRVIYSFSIIWTKKVCFKNNSSENLPLSCPIFNHNRASVWSFRLLPSCDWFLLHAFDTLVKPSFKWLLIIAWNPNLPKRHTLMFLHNNSSSQLNPIVDDLQWTYLQLSAFPN